MVHSLKNKKRWLNTRKESNYQSRLQTQIELVYQTHSRSQCLHCFNNIKFIKYELELEPLGPIPRIEPGICSDEHTPHEYSNLFWEREGESGEEKTGSWIIHDVALDQKTHTGVRLCLKHSACCHWYTTSCIPRSKCVHRCSQNSWLHPKSWGDLRRSAWEP